MIDGKEQEWIVKAAQEIDTKTRDSPDTADGWWWASIQWKKRLIETIAKNAPSYSAEDVERLVEASSKVLEAYGEKSAIWAEFIEAIDALKPFQKEK